MLLEQKQLKYSIRSSDGTTAFHYLVRNIVGASEQFKLQKALEKCLTAGGVDVDVLAKNGETPLHQAVMRNNEFTVKFLLENGANVNAVDDRNTVPLFYAVGQNSLSIVAILLRNGANPNIKGKRGSPLELAKEQKNPEIISLLSRCMFLHFSPSMMIIMLIDW
jgi:ankyrin repeat protein